MVISKLIVVNHFAIYSYIKSLCYALKMNTMLYVNHVSISKITNKKYNSTKKDQKMEGLLG